jgi:hypothetical protein
MFGILKSLVLITFFVLLTLAIGAMLLIAGFGFLTSFGCLF